MNYVPAGSRNTRDVMGVYDSNNEDIRSSTPQIPTEGSAQAVTADNYIQVVPLVTSPTPDSCYITKKTTKVVCTVLFEAVHNWPTCNIEEVSYLRNPHRHVFHIKCVATVTHDDRDIEFIVMKHQVENFLNKSFPTRYLGSTSCEQLANMILDNFSSMVECSVFEDGENGAIVTREQVTQAY